MHASTSLPQKSNYVYKGWPNFLVSARNLEHYLKHFETFGSPKIGKFSGKRMPLWMCVHFREDGPWRTWEHVIENSEMCYWELVNMTLRNCDIHHWEHHCKVFHDKMKQTCQISTKYVVLKISHEECRHWQHLSRVMNCHVNIQSFLVIIKSLVLRNISGLPKNIKYLS